MLLPTFIIAGAPKCGTTALWNYLKEHPKVCMSRIKEPRFFSQIQGELDKGKMGSGPLRPGYFNRGLKWYESLFDSCQQSKVRGEASTYYFSAIDSAALIKSLIPEVRLIFLLRDPVERLYSHYWQEYKLGLKLPSFEDMVQNNHPRFQYYSHVSSYKINLERFYLEFPKNQVLLLLNEDLKKNPQEIFQQVCQFLGLDDNYFPTSLGKKFNQQTLPKNQLLEQIITTISSKDIIVERVPHSIRPYLGKIKRTISKVNSIKNDYPPLKISLRNQLVNRFEADIAFVEECLFKNLSFWRS